MFPGWVAALEDQTRLDLSYRRGIVSVAFTDTDLSALQTQATRRARQGFGCEMLTPHQVLELERAVSPAIEGGVLFHTDCSIDNTLLVEALAVVARQQGVEFRLGTRVDRGP
jgi:glycine/D-amino acid oxidase-like deaminating enzyme